MAKGVRLVWEGKRAAQTTFDAVPYLRRQEAYGAMGGTDTNGNQLIEGDNLAAMAALRAGLAGKVALIYLDPPFFTGAEWQAQVAGAQKQRLPAYTDAWDGDLGAYLQWMLDRLTLARELLAKEGSLYVHLSWQAAHYVKLLLDEVFGPARFQNEIVWCYREAINSRKRWNRKHDTLLFYSKSERFTFNPEAVLDPYADSNVKKYKRTDEKGAYRLMGRGITGSPLRSRRDLPPEYEAQFPGLTYRHYLGQGTLPVDYWRIDIENQASRLRTGYPTQKPEALLERILLASSNPGDLIADLCCGSGTTLAVASRLGRRWIGCDNSSVAIHTTRKRLLEYVGCAPFAVERVEREATLAPAAESCPPHSCPEVIVESAGGGVRLRLTPEAVPEVDMWAVEWQGGSQAIATGDAQLFCPHWWAARTRQHPALAEVSPILNPEQGVHAARVKCFDASGSMRMRTVALAPG